MVTAILCLCVCLNVPSPVVASRSGVVSCSQWEPGGNRCWASLAVVRGCLWAGRPQPWALPGKSSPHGRARGCGEWFMPAERSPLRSVAPHLYCLPDRMHTATSLSSRVPPPLLPRMPADNGMPLKAGNKYIVFFFCFFVCVCAQVCIDVW